MIRHEIRLVGLAVASTVYAVDADSVLQTVPGLALGTLGFVALVWRLVKDNDADARIRAGFQSVIEAERFRANAAEERARHLESILKELMDWAVDPDDLC